MDRRFSIRSYRHRIATAPQRGYGQVKSYARLALALLTALCMFSLPLSTAYALSAAALSGSSYFNTAAPGGGGCSVCHGAPTTGASAFTLTVSLQPLSYYAGNAANFGPGITAANSPSMGSTATPGTNAANAVANQNILAAYFAETYFAVPGAPTIGTATAGNAQATVTFTAPTSALPITSYTVTPYIGAVAQATTSGTASPITVTGLTNGTSYTFKVTATSNAGTGAASAATNAVTPATVPNAPTMGTVTAGNGQASVPFTFTNTVPSNGGASVTSYIVTPYIGAVAQATTSGTVSPITVTGLSNGTSYTFRVAAVNSVGTGTSSAASNAVTPATVPNAPTIGTATAGDTQVSVSFSFSNTVPNNGGASVTSYIVTPYIGAVAQATTSGTASPIAVTGLTNGTAYTFTVAAVNSAGTGATSVASNSATPFALATAPTITSVSAGNAQATVNFNPPSSFGSGTFVNYTVTPYVGATAGTPVNGAASPITVTGLTNGTTYTFTVSVTTSVGTTTNPTPSNAVTPATLPNAPAIGIVTSGNAQATVPFTFSNTVPSNGGATVTSYIVTPYIGATAQTTTAGAASPITVTGLSNGTAYTFTVAAVNNVGTGTASAASNSVTPATFPGAPTITGITGGNAQAGIAFSAPASNGGAAITSYTANCGGITGSAAASPVTVTGLTNGTTYSCTVAATNSVGTGPASAPSNVTPATVPGAPGIVSTVIGDGQVTVSFNPPASNGGATITGYTVTPYINNVAQTPTSGTGSPIVVTGLSNGTAYTFTVSATNSVGSTRSAPSAAVTPYAPPVANNSTVHVLSNSSANVITPNISGVVNASGLTILTGTAHGTTTTTAANTFIYTPTVNYFGADTLTYTVSGPGGNSANANITIQVDPIPPAASNAALTVALNTTATLDLAPFITGTAITGISIATAPVHGTAIVSGTRVSYTPARDYYGTDSFTYLAYGAAGASPSTGTVNVTVTGRPDPLQDKHVTALLDAQAATLSRTAAAQTINFRQHLETLHHPLHTPLATNMLQEDETPLGRAPATFGNTASGPAFALSGNGQPGTDYRNDPQAMLHQAPSGGPASDPMMAALMNIARGLASSSTLDLGDIAKAVPGDKTAKTVELWAAGNLRFGSNTQAGANTQFVSDGISLGVDRRIDRQLTLGMGVGYARDNSTIGTDGSSSKARGTSLTGYASYQMEAGTYLDGLLGLGKVNFDTSRYVTALNGYASGTRQGNQLFGSLAYGYEYRDDGVMWSPYGRYDFNFDRLNASTETGVGALNYASQTMNSASIALGLRGQTAHQTEFGLVQPRARLEYQRATNRSGPTSVAYADLLATRYNLAATTRNDNAFVFGLGSDFLMSDTWRLGVDYQHLGGKGPQNYQSVNVSLSKMLNGKNDFDFLLADSATASVSKPSGLNVVTGYAYDDNVNRAGDPRERLSDTIYSATVSKSYTTVLAKRHRFMLSGFLDSEMFRTYTGLDHVSAGIKTEYAFRPSAAFFSPTLGVFLRATRDQFSSTLRSGSQRSAGVSLRDSLTDRISLFTALSDNARNGKSDVFNTRDRSARVNLDYAVSAAQTLYLGGEYRRGDVVASAWAPALNILNISTVFVRDDVFTAPGYTDYRFKGKTKLFTLGYNIGFGPKDAIDLSWRRANSSPDTAAGANSRYIANQYSLNYLMAF